MPGIVFFATKDGAGADEGKGANTALARPLPFKVQKEKELKERAAFPVRENSSQITQMLFQHFEHVRQDLKA